MTIRSLLLAGLLAATAVPVAAQDYYGSGYDDRGGYDQRRDIRSVADFEAPLARYGRWVPSRFGRAWVPNVARDWRPYTVGHWVDSEDGETWESDEPWGWATYHYGRWGFDDHYGWVWVADTQWAPAWVAWRDGDDYAGWAPLPPQGVYGSGYNDWDYDRWYAPSWIYVQRGNLYRRDIGRAVLPWRGNRGYWDRTRQQQHGWNGRDGGRDWSDGHRAGQPGRDWSDGRRASQPGGPGQQAGPGGANWSNRDRLRDAARFGNQPTPPSGGSQPTPPNSGYRPTPPNGNTGIVPPRDGRPGQGWNGDPRGQQWDGGARARDPNPRGDRAGDGRDRGSGGMPASATPGQWQGRPDSARGREGAPIAVQNAGRDRPAPSPPPQAQPRPPVQPQAQPRPAPEAQPQAQPARPDRPARADNPRRERGDKQPE